MECKEECYVGLPTNTPGKNTEIMLGYFSFIKKMHVVVICSSCSGKWLQLLYTTYIYKDIWKTILVLSLLLLSVRSVDVISLAKAQPIYTISENDNHPI